MTVSLFMLFTFIWHMNNPILVRALYGHNAHCYPRRPYEAHDTRFISVPPLYHLLDCKPPRGDRSEDDLVDQTALRRCTSSDV